MITRKDYFNKEDAEKRFEDYINSYSSDYTGDILMDDMAFYLEHYQAPELNGAFGKTAIEELYALVAYRDLSDFSKDLIDIERGDGVYDRAFDVITDVYRDTNAFDVIGDLYSGRTSRKYAERMRSDIAKHYGIELAEKSLTEELREPDFVTSFASDKDMFSHIGKRLDEEMEYMALVTELNRLVSSNRFKPNDEKFDEITESDPNFFAHLGYETLRVYETLYELRVRYGTDNEFMSDMAKERMKEAPFRAFYDYEPIIAEKRNEGLNVEYDVADAYEAGVSAEKKTRKKFPIPDFDEIEAEKQRQDDELDIPF